MAAPMKRPSEDISKDVPRKKVAVSNDEKLTIFMEWCDQNNFKVSPKVTVCKKDSCAQYGMIAVEDITEGYCLFQVPRSCLLMPQNTDISNLIDQDSDKLSSTNQWIPLLIALIHEQSKDSSKWRPYLDLVPDYTALDLPIFWNRQDIDKFLTNSRVDTSVSRDLKMMKDDFDKLVAPFFQRHTNQIGDDLKDLEHFKRQVAFVMAYSFTEPKEEGSGNEKSHSQNDISDSDSEDEEQQMSPPMMVPMADMLNHVTNHNAKLTFGKEALKMVTTRNIKKGEEIFNTYGQVSNLHLMHMYGFSERYPDNIHDVVEVPVSVMLDAALDIDDSNNSEFLKKKWTFLMDQEILLKDEIFVIGREGIISDELCVETMKVLCKKPAELEEYKVNGAWSDGESDSSLSGDSKLSIDKIPKLDKKWKQLLKRLAELHMSGYPTTIDQDNEKIKTSSVIGEREKYSLYLVHSQKMTLQSLINACS